MSKILQGDALEVLKTLKDESVQMCVTSPPFWGLRDYGTAEWEGGSKKCKHIESENKHSGQRADRNQDGYKKLYTETCGKCGAVRIDKQLGLEETPEEYVENLVAVMREVRRVLKNDGVLWLNLGDSYVGTGHKGELTDPKHKEGRNGQKVALNNKVQGLKPKDLVGIPWTVAFALRADGWWLRQDIIWHKPGPMPESVTDRCTKSHEYIFLLSKNKKYYYNADAIKEKATSAGSIHVHKDGNKMSEVADDPKFATKPQRNMVTGEYRNKRSVWTVNPARYKDAHFAVFPPDLIVPCIKAGSAEGDVVLDCFMGSGTTAMVASELNRKWLGVELNPEYIKLAMERINPRLGI